MTLRVSRLDGRVTLTLPPRLPWSEALAFLRAREGWLRDQVARAGAPELPPGLIRFRGGVLSVTPGPVRRLTQGAAGLIVPEGQPQAARLTAFLKAAARDDLSAACDRHAAALGRGYARLTLRDTRSRWGSCSSKGDLMFSWRLVMAPPSVLDYVAAHEVAHLVEMNHSADYWAVVGRICPGWKRERTWLRAEGQELHRFRFRDPSGMDGD
jgi:predicted metal-dependent hydrolase